MTTDPKAATSFWSNLPFSEFLRYWDFRPRTSWFQHFITINNNAGDAPIEEQVLGEVGSYGYQLSRIIDAVRALIDGLEASGSLTKLDPAQQQIIANLRQLDSDVNATVDGYWRQSGGTRITT